MPPRIFADFQNADDQGRLRLNCRGTIDDLHQLQVTLEEGLNVVLYAEDIEVDGEVQFSRDESIWVAEIDWDDIRQVDTSTPVVAADE